MLRCIRCDKKEKEGERHYCKVDMTSRIAKVGLYFVAAPFWQGLLNFCKKCLGPQKLSEHHRNPKFQSRILVITNPKDKNE